MPLHRLAALLLVIIVSAPAFAQEPPELDWRPIASGAAIELDAMPRALRQALRDGEFPSQRLFVYQHGLITLHQANDGRVPHDPMPLAQPGVSFIAALWHRFDAPCGENNRIWYAIDGSALVVRWRDMTTDGRGCFDWAPKTTFSVRIEVVDGDVLRLTFRYEAIETQGPVRAGIALRDDVNELLPDPDERPFGRRAEYLLRWGSDGERGAAHSIHGFDESGVWIMDLAPDGRALGDPDGDGLRGADNCPNDANPDQRNMPIRGQMARDDEGDLCDRDHDNDRVPNLVDNCVRIPNRDQTDRDRSGLGDLCDPHDRDADNDGVVDERDNCPRLVNPLQLDLDADGMGDVCDGDPDGDRLLEVDRHGVTRDLCPWAYDPVQKDADRDGLGDACDADRLHWPLRDRLETQSDMDGDGRSDGRDNCPLAPNQDQADADGDRVGDVCDPDMDGNTILDVFEGRKPPRPRYR